MQNLIEVLNLLIDILDRVDLFTIVKAIVILFVIAYFILVTVFTFLIICMILMLKKLDNIDSLIISKKGIQINNKKLDNSNTVKKSCKKKSDSKKFTDCDRD